MKSKFHLLLFMLLFTSGLARAVDVPVWTMNNQDKVLKVLNKANGQYADVGEKDGYRYSIPLEPGLYEFSMYDADGENFLGALDVTVEDVESHGTVMLYIATLTVGNTHEDGFGWAEGTDYTLSARLLSQKGEPLSFRAGHNNKGMTIIARQGSNLTGVATPSQANLEAGYLEYSLTNAITGNRTMNLTMPKGVLTSVTIPEDARLQIGTKSAHFVDFTLIEPKTETVNGDTRTFTYLVLPNKQINYRTWRDGGLTRAGYFTSAKDESEKVEIEFTEDDYEAFDPKSYNQDVNSNQGYETGDIFVNGNERGHISLAVGETFMAHAMRTWQLTDTSTANYFMEPDFHYTVVGLDGKPLEGVLELTSKPGSAWTEIKGVAPGTAIVLVTYDAIGVNKYNKAVKEPFMGGEIWGAIWPENTGVYVVTVGEDKSAVEPQMFINEEYNTGTLKVAGKNVDAEHDIFYYLDTENGYSYTFSPKNVEDISIAYPEIGETEVRYTGFIRDGVTRNDDGSWSILLRHGRQIVRMTDANGNASYQVMRARRCHREIVNVTRPASKIFQPGDQVKVQYSGLFHPANKLAGIYNMSAYVTYNGSLNGTSLIQGASQYTFGSAPAAQAVTFNIPEDFNTDENGEFRLSDGVLQVNGYGDPIGNHRIIDPEKGRNANFNAQAHKTYFGAIPDVSLSVSPFRKIYVSIVPNVKDLTLSVVHNGKELTPAENGYYEGTIGTYSVTAKKAGYYCLRQDFTVADDAEGLQTFAVDLRQTPAGAWDGVTMTRPQTEEGVYSITTGAEFAWFANEMNTNAATESAVLGADIDLGDYDWTPIGTASNEFTGIFDGKGHTVSHLYINNPKKNYQGLFGYVGREGAVRSIRLEGEITGSDYTGSIAGRVSKTGALDQCANYAKVTGNRYSGGVVGYLFNKGILSNSYNAGIVSGNDMISGLIGADFDGITENVFNIGEVVCPSNAGAFTYSMTQVAKENTSNVFVIREYDVKHDYTVADAGQFESGEIAYLLGDAFGQTIGSDAYPVIGGEKVYKVEYYMLEEALRSRINDDEEAEILYTNGTLPGQLDGRNIVWYEDAEMSKPVMKIESDATLYARRDIITGIGSISYDDAAARWFTIEGFEIKAPVKGTHGVFIRVIKGKAEKVVM